MCIRDSARTKEDGEDRVVGMFERLMDKLCNGREIEGEGGCKCI